MSQTNKQFVLHKRQKEAIDLTKDNPVVKYVGGIRGGKTITGSHFALENIYNRPNEVGAIFAPTHNVLAKMTLKEFKAVLASYGLIQDTHYVVGKRPDPYFGYKSKFPEDHSGIWSFMNGAQIMTFSLESFYRGAEFGWAWGDEIQSSSRDDLDTVLGRMSGSKKPRTLYTYTPPADNPEIDEITYGDKALPGVFGTTYDNQKNLPEGYIEMLRSTMDELTFAREVLCERKPMSGLNWLYTFNRDKHTSESAVYQPNQIVYLSFDFNNNPFVCTLSHRGSIPGKRHGYIHYFGTVVLDPDKVVGRTYIEAICEAISINCPMQWRNKAFMVTGDASGGAQSVLKRVGENIWTDIVRGLGISARQLVLPKANPRHKDSRELCNAIFQNYDEVLINPECRELVRDCEFVKANPDGTIVKDNRKKVTQQADLLDALRYDLNAFSGDFIKRLG